MWDAIRTRVGRDKNLAVIMAKSDQFVERIKAYCQKHRLDCGPCLGQGTQGTVYAVQDSTGRQAAVKFHGRQIAYQRERDVYLRLKHLDVTDIAGHRVPVLINSDDELLVLEMTIVSPPFALDFGGAYRDKPPDYSEQVWADWMEEKRETFEDNWPAVETILADFRLLGIYIADVNPRNIRFS